jgi:hypothetical protein
MFQIALLKLITLGFISAFLPLFYNDHEIYINGMFNNYSLTLNSNYNPKKGFTKKAILIKQGFTNFEYVVVDDKGAIDKKNAVDGNFTKPKMIILF